MIIENEKCSLSPELEDFFETNAGESSDRACQVKQGNSCGSGCVVGHYNGGTLVLTNWHVVSRGIGTTAQCVFRIGNQNVTKVGKVIMGAYSQRVTADWVILFIENWQQLKPVYCTRQRPKLGELFYTTGSPSCVWPLRHQSGLKLLSNNNAGFAIWDKTAIPGQSGSSVFNAETNLSQILLTWRTGNGNGAGQPLDYIYGQARTALETGALIGGQMPKDAEPLSGDVGELEEGFFCEASIRNLPIWFEDLKPQPQPQPQPNPEKECCNFNKDILEYLEKNIEESKNLIEKIKSCGTESPSPVPNKPETNNLYGL
jgi:hypothetical protein